jgi:glycosyltransferase involved in cell wall biosynthesis
MNREMVIHGRTGFLADSPEAWANAVARLAADPELRARMGAAGREQIEQHYSVHRWAPRFAQLVDSVARGVHAPFAAPSEGEPWREAAA